MHIRTENLTHIYMAGTPFAVTAIRDITINVNPGSFTAIIGPSGSGKSTLLQHLNGLLKATTGRVMINGLVVGEDKNELLSLRRRIGLVFQMPEEQFFAESVFAEVAYAPRNQELQQQQVQERVHYALKQVKLDYNAIIERSPFQLSSGQKRLVAIASVLALQPEALILDEPAAGLDPAGCQLLYSLLSNLNREKGLTIMVVTHHLENVAALADNYLVLSGGQLVMQGPPEKIFNQGQQLQRLGLDLPPVTRLMQLLAERGAPVKGTVFSLEQACQEINGWLRAGESL